MCDMCEIQARKLLYAPDTSHGSEILYVLTVEDLEGCFNDDGRTQGKFEDLPLEERQGVIRTVKQFIGSWAGDSMYNWDDAIQDGIETYYRDKARDTYNARNEGRSDAKVQS